MGASGQKNKELAMKLIVEDMARKNAEADLKSAQD